MAVDERARYELQRALIELLGEDAAMTLMGHLPPAGWADLATRRDVESVRDAVHRLDDRLDQRFRQFVTSMIAAVFASALASAGIALAVSGVN
jgi:hypothetical protein